MKTVTAYQSSTGQLFANREEYVRAELSNVLAVGPDVSTDKQVDAVIKHKALFLELLSEPKIRKKRGPNKPKVVAPTAS